MSPAAARFAKYSKGLLIYTVLVIVWGSSVRATGSGDGCGANWPLCNGEALPLSGSVKTLIEFSHRLTSGLVLPLALLLAFFAFRLFPKRSPQRSFSVGAVIFVMVEALIGMMLVKNGWVGLDASVSRAVVISMHLVNTFLLLGCLTMVVHYATGGSKLQIKGQGSLAWGVLLGLAVVLTLGVSGAITALGDTLMKPATHADGINRSISATAHFLERLRVLHPLIATSAGVYLLLIGGLVNHLRPHPRVAQYTRWITFVFLTQMALGIVNLALMAPIPMQLLHLAVADTLWILLVLQAATAFQEGLVHREELESVPANELQTALRGKDLIKAYVALTKPRVISLLLFTTLTAMFAAAGGWPGFWLFLAVAVGGYAAAGAANAINMVIDRDIDGTMKRTSKRPTVTQQISSRNALFFAFSLEALSFGLLWSVANLLSALMALAGLAFYVVVYTLILKRRTWHNIVIGGAAGAFPPLVGWSAVTGELNPLAWWLFAIIFLWTPVHFWALALLIKDDYAKANIPMLPVVHGERVTVLQIGLYAVLTAIISIMPLVQRQVGLTYLTAAVVLNLVLLMRCVSLIRVTDRPRTVSLYKYSMVYLALLFLMVAIDRYQVVRF